MMYAATFPLTNRCQHVPGAHLRLTSQRPGLTGPDMHSSPTVGERERGVSDRR